MFASFTDMMAEGTVLLFISAVVLSLFVKKYLKENTDVKDTAKKAVAKGAIRGIGMIVKRLGK